MPDPATNRPRTTVVLAMSADGKIADAKRSPPQFGSLADKAHLEKQVAQADGVLFGARTLRTGGTAMRVVNPDLLKQRELQKKPSQPVQIVCSRSAKIDPQLPFFRQAVPRWLLTTDVGALHWQAPPEKAPGFERVLAIEAVRPTALAAGVPGNPDSEIDWIVAFSHLKALGLEQIAVLGGGELIASLLLVDLIDEIWLTICPLLLGGVDAPTPVEGSGLLVNLAPRLELLSVQPIGQEVFLHYRLQR